MKYFGMLAIFLQDKSAADTWNCHPWHHHSIPANYAGLHLLQEMSHLVKNLECTLVRVGGCCRRKCSFGKDLTSDVITNHVLNKSSMHTWLVISSKLPYLHYIPRRQRIVFEHF